MELMMEQTNAEPVRRVEAYISVTPAEIRELVERRYRGSEIPMLKSQWELISAWAEKNGFTIELCCQHVVYPHRPLSDVTSEFRDRWDPPLSGLVVTELRRLSSDGEVVRKVHADLEALGAHLYVVSNGANPVSADELSELL